MHCPDDCMGHGMCQKATGECDCTGGFASAKGNCADYTCNPKDCNGHGRCDASKKRCVCFLGYGGSDCSRVPCPGNCRGEGKCDPKTGKCTCNIGITGVDCSKRECPEKCGENGKCDELTSVCLCNPGWEGADCTKKIRPCSRECPKKSKCNAKTKRCVCNHGWTGRDCETKQCPNDCSGHGSCNANSGKCSCFSGWGAFNCGARPYHQAWGYHDQGGLVGPDSWSTLTPHFASCANGQFQSPISLPWDGKDGRLDQFFHNITFPDTVIDGYLAEDNGRFYTAKIPMVDEESEQSQMYFHAGEHRYELKNVTIHTPSEHKIGTTQYDMEMQLHHEDSFGNLASVAVLFSAVEEIQGDFYQKFTRSDFWRGYVANRGVTRGTYLNIQPYLPKNKQELHFYSYHGSQTHPPCYEGVHWFVMSRAHQVLKSDMDHLMLQYGSNSRPVQPSLGRSVSFF